ncbi:MAG: two-component system, NarL family, sensor kinase, partial [Subtercola sp.]|nr:two-component system, NarL family, sensor kinase [Subtercola sp.]
RDPAPLARRRLLAWVAAAAVAVIALVVVLGLVAARALAETEAVNGAAKRADLIADALVEPDLTDGLLTADPRAIARMDEVVQNHVLSTSIARVKIWAPSGEIVYSDEPRLIGRTFDFGDDEREAFESPEVRAEVSNLDAPENVYETSGGKLLETYRSVSSPSGQEFLFEAYFRYDEVDVRTTQLFDGFSWITVGSVLLLVLLLAPVLWRLLRLLHREQRRRAELLQRSLDASAAERRRIAATLHDGVVQDLAGISFALSGSAGRAAGLGDERLASDLAGAAATVRGSIGGLRSLLVDIYPPSLETAGIEAALTDLAAGLRSRGVEVLVAVDDNTVLDAPQSRLVFRVAQECLVNAAKHSGASHVVIRLGPSRQIAQLDISDDGSGFDAQAALRSPVDGHFGLRVMADVVSEAGAELALSTAPGSGTSWRLRLQQVSL